MTRKAKPPRTKKESLKDKRQAKSGNETKNRYNQNKDIQYDIDELVPMRNDERILGIDK